MSDRIFLPDSSALSALMDELDLPMEAKQYFLHLDSVSRKNEKTVMRIVSMLTTYYTDFTYENIASDMQRTSDELGATVYSTNMLFFLYAAVILSHRYENKIPHDIFINTMADLRCKMLECYRLHKVWGAFTPTWYDRFYKMERFGLGRLQYEPVSFPMDSYVYRGHCVEKGSTVYNMHIPSMGPLTRELRMDSYRQAYAFFRDTLQDGILVCVCTSWLLFAEHEAFLPCRSNILDFMHDFTILKSWRTEKFPDSWRVFGNASIDDPAHLPRETSLQRAYAEWLSAGNQSGGGYGIFLFDGEKIL